MHYLLLISDKPDMVFRTELLMRSIKKYSSGKESAFSIVVNGDRKTESGWIDRQIELEKSSISNRFISDNAEVLRSEYYWSIPAPSRWFIPPKADTCILIDVDVMACKDLSPLYGLENDCVHGVTAYDMILSDRQWIGLGLGKEELKRYYFNFGMLVVPSKYLHDIGRWLLISIPRIIAEFPEHYYYSAQIALAVTLKEQNVKTNNLHNKFNWYDILPPSKDKKFLKSIIFLHYFCTQCEINNKESTFGESDNVYKNMIMKESKSIFLPKI